MPGLLITILIIHHHKQSSSTQHTQCLSVSISQKSSSAQQCPLIQGHSRLQPWSWPAIQSQKTLGWPRSASKSPWSLTDCISVRLQNWGPCLWLPLGSQRLTHLSVSEQSNLFLQSQQSEMFLIPACWDRVFFSITMGRTSDCICHSLLQQLPYYTREKEKHRPPPAFKGKGLYNGVKRKQISQGCPDLSSINPNQVT